MLLKDYSAFSSEFTRKEVADFIYKILINDVVVFLEKQKSYNYENDLISLGEQVANGASIYWNRYVAAITDTVKNKLYLYPEKFIWTLWQNITYVDIPYIDNEDEVEYLKEYINPYDDIAYEVFQRLCTIAENAYYKVCDDNT